MAKSDKKPITRKKSNAKAEGAGALPTEQEIRQRAYEIYQGRAGAYGDPVADWLRAEQELQGKRS